MEGHALPPVRDCLQSSDWWRMFSRNTYHRRRSFCIWSHIPEICFKYRVKSWRFYSSTESRAEYNPYTSETPYRCANPFSLCLYFYW